MIKEDFLADYGITEHALAKAFHNPHRRVTDIVKGRRGTPEPFLRSARQSWCHRSQGDTSMDGSHGAACARSALQRPPFLAT